ncbi:MAG: PAS domain S-box protein, partial [Smithella sp.]
MKDQSLRVLMVEDSEDDVLLIIRELKKGGHNPLYERVETAAAMKKALKEKQWDIILCDYKMPKFSGPSAITALKETNIDIPLIIVSGAMSEEAAVESMRLGAHDYIMKGNLSRLCPAIDRELKEVEVRNKQKHVEKDLKESENKYRLSFENVTDVVYTIDNDLNISSVSPSVERVLGYKPQDFIGQPVFNLGNILTPESFEQAIVDISSVLKGETISATIYQFIAKDGTIKYGEVSGSPLMRKGKIIGIISVARDISDRKLVEEALRESEKSLRAQYNGNPIPTYTWQKQGDEFILKDFNNSAKIFTIGQRNSFLGKQASEMYKNRQEILGNLKKCFDEKRIIRIESISEHFMPDKFVVITFVFVPPDLVMVHMEDITERKKMEEALQWSEEKYRNILENIEDGYYEIDLAGNLTFFNDSLRRITGYTKEELMGMNYRQYEDKKSLKKVIQTYNKVYKTGEPIEGFDRQIIRKDGTKRYVEVSVSLQKESSGKPIGFRGIARDVTERKQAEAALQESEEKYRTILETIQEGYFEVDLTGNFTFFNDSLSRILGYSREEMLGLNDQQYADKENAKKLFQAFNKVYKTGESTEGFDWQVIRKDGTKRYVEASVSLRKDSSGKPNGFRGIARDITERKQAEDALRESEKKYRTILEDIEDVYFEVDIKGIITFVNPSSCKMSGYSEEELIGMSFKKISAPDGIEMVTQYFGEIFLTDKTGKPFLWNLVKKNGELGFFEIIVSLIRNKQGKSIGFRGIGRDITERKQTEEKLLLTLASLRKAFGTTIQVMVSAVELRDPYTSGHQTRSADLARAIATEMGLSQDQIDGIRLAGSIHDIGKLSVPAEILSKPTKLTDLEFTLIKEHSRVGYEMLKDVESPWPLAQIVYQH